MHTVAIAVMSLDGCLTRHDEEGTAFASAADQKHFREALRIFDCAVMGGGSYRVARESILADRAAARLRVVLTRTPGRYAADARSGVLEFRSDDIASVIESLAARGYSQCAVVGGARLLTSCLQAKLLGELWLTLEPVAFGEGRRLIEGAAEFRFELVSMEMLGASTVLLRYRSS